MGNFSLRRIVHSDSVIALHNPTVLNTFAHNNTTHVVNELALICIDRLAILVAYRGYEFQLAKCVVNGINLIIIGTFYTHN